MSNGLSLRDLVFELEDKDFSLEVSKNQRSIEVRKPEETGEEVLVTIGIVNPSEVTVTDSIKYLENSIVRDLLPPVFNYVLSFLAKTEIGLSELKAGKDRKGMVKDIKTEDSNYIRQGMIDTLIRSDKLMLMADVYGEKVCRRIDLLSAIKESGYQDSRVNVRDLNIYYHGKHVATISLDEEHMVSREFHWVDFPKEKRKELTTLLKWYVDTPKKFRNISFSLLEQILITNLPRQYQWAYRDEDNRLWAINEFRKEDAAKKEIVCDAILFKMITKKNPFPTHLGRLDT